MKETLPGTLKEQVLLLSFWAPCLPPVSLLLRGVKIVKKDPLLTFFKTLMFCGEIKLGILQEKSNYL